MSTPTQFQVGGKYNWRDQSERLSYMGTMRHPGDPRCWHQFEKVEKPGVVWCEVLESDLPFFEESAAPKVKEDAKAPAAEGVSKARIPTEQQIIAAANEAGLWVNTACRWIPQFQRYHAIIDRMLAASESGVSEPVDQPVARFSANGLGASGFHLTEYGGATLGAGTTMLYTHPKALVAGIDAGVVEALKKIIAATHSHVDGRDLLAELHPRRSLDIKRRRDGVETWFEGDWLSNLWAAVKEGRAALLSLGAQGDTRHE